MDKKGGNAPKGGNGRPPAGPTAGNVRKGGRTGPPVTKPPAPRK